MFNEILPDEYEVTFFIHDHRRAQSLWLEPVENKDTSFMCGVAYMPGDDEKAEEKAFDLGLEDAEDAGRKKFYAFTASEKITFYKGNTMDCSFGRYSHINFDPIAEFVDLKAYINRRLREYKRGDRDDWDD